MGHHSPNLSALLPAVIPRWSEFALLDCWAAYPALGSTNFFDPEPAPGNISLIITEQCKNYYYSSESGYPFFYSVTDEWGQKWALQTSHQNLTTEAEWDTMVDQIAFPPGWSAPEKVPLNETGEEHNAFLVDGKCIIPVFKDALFNTWHAYTYPEGGLTSGESLFNAVGKTCERLDPQYTAKYAKQSAEEPSGEAAAAPAPAPATPPSAALGRTGAPAAFVGALTVLAAALLF
ncbi:hypothetical protein COHA_003677 [Chlorella ohadii]|uniref:Uncharacterized protein n=1 Tax=Chlorella ohadii TaxID=2649997 RepID=A0AAD5H3B3_9CHLO|nr:hypothetical protein COHA_003677 [Chlorella ohadii]